MIVQGILHLLTGFDHLSFPARRALLGVVRRKDVNDARPLHTAAVESLKVVTAFTVAHSITLTLAALGAGRSGSSGCGGFDRGDGFRDCRVGVLEAHPLSWMAFGGSVRTGAWIRVCRGARGGLMGGEAGRSPVALFSLGIELAQVAVALALVPLLFVLTRRAAVERWVSPGDFGGGGDARSATRWAR